MTADEKQALHDIRKFHVQMLHHLRGIDKRIRECSDLKALADAAFMLRELYAFMDQLRKEANRHKELAAKIFTVIYMSDPTITGSVETDYCTTYPDPKTRASVPKKSKDPERYARVMRSLGVPDEAIAAGALQVHWDAFGELLTQRVKDGQPLPDGIDPDATYTEFRLHIRAKRGLNVGQQKLATASRDDQQPASEGESYVGSSEDFEPSADDDDSPF